MGFVDAICSPFLGTNMVRSHSETRADVPAILAVPVRSTGEITAGPTNVTETRLRVGRVS